LSAVDELAAALRAATRDDHRGIDHHPLLAPLARRALLRRDYARALRALYGPQAALEAWLADFLPAAILPPRLPDLAADLAALGVTPWPLAVPLPAWPAHPAVRLGVAYVIEGANLGGAVIARHLPVDFPRRFFANAGGPVRWQRFWQFAAKHADACAAPDQAAAAATSCFAWYRRHLDACLTVDARSQIRRP
jgi:heme oxygenase